MTIDERRLSGLIEESQDLQVDALRTVPAAVADLRDVAAERSAATPAPDELSAFDHGRRVLLRKLGLGAGTVAAGGLFAGGIGTAVSSLLASPAAADTPLDIQILQTASSLEILAVATYGAALTLPFISGGNPVVLKFAQTTMMQHDQHRQAFQSQTTALGGKVQTNPNPKYLPVVDAAKPNLKSPTDVVSLAATLEQVATDTYLSDIAMFNDNKSRQVMLSVMGVESQHLATLRAVGALLAANLPQLIAIPTNLAELPAAAGSVAFPMPTEGTSKASPPAEGALQ